MSALGTGRRLLAALLLLALVTGAAFATNGRPDDGPVAPTEAELKRLQDRIDGAPLERDGIFFARSSIEEERRCVALQLLNPSRANISFLREQYGPGLCPNRRPAGGYAETAVGCAVSAPKRDAAVVTVPYVRGLPPHLAAKRMRAAGLTACYTTSRPGRYDAANVLRVMSQCPRAGTPGAAVGALRPCERRIPGRRLPLHRTRRRQRGLRLSTTRRVPAGVAQVDAHRHSPAVQGSSASDCCSQAVSSSSRCAASWARLA